MKRWVLGTHQGGIAAQHVDAYLDEFVFRFNQRFAKKRGLLFYRLIENAVVIKKLQQETIVLSRRGQATARRGPAPRPENTLKPRGRAAATAKNP